MNGETMSSPFIYPKILSRLNGEKPDPELVVALMRDSRDGTK